MALLGAMPEAGPWTVDPTNCGADVDAAPTTPPSCATREPDRLPSNSRGHTCSVKRETQTRDPEERIGSHGQDGRIGGSN
jgi:hypothetical protein